MDPTLLAIILVVAAAAIAVTVLWRARRSRSEGQPQQGTSKIESGLWKSRRAIGSSLASVLGRGRLEGSFFEELEEILVAADVGVPTSQAIVERVRAGRPESVDGARELLRSEIRSVFGDRPRGLRLEGQPSVLLVVGVNGTGKTTSIAKLAARLESEGRRTMLGAADTFRAAADVQLRSWAERVGVDIVGGKPGSDPAAVAFDAYSAAKARGKQVVIIDTAGRLHSKTELMAELRKVRRVVEREAREIGDVLLVLDATGGQNSLNQARVFLEAVGVNGIILTKLDGTAKGGIVVAIEGELGVPVKFVGVGEEVEDLVPFDPVEFVDALLGDA